MFTTIDLLLATTDLFLAIGYLGFTSDDVFNATLELCGPVRVGDRIFLDDLLVYRLDRKLIVMLDRFRDGRTHGTRDGGWGDTARRAYEQLSFSTRDLGLTMSDRAFAGDEDLAAFGREVAEQPSSGIFAIGRLGTLGGKR